VLSALPEEPLMPDQTVEVSFDPNAEPQFTFVPETVTMTAAGKVVFLRRPPGSPWTFKDGTVKNDTSNQFSSSVQGNNLRIDDKFLDGSKTRHEYTITVEFNGKPGRTYESPDPVIVNDPGGVAP
jgi:hypothetical protein